MRALFSCFVFTIRKKSKGIRLKAIISEVRISGQECKLTLTGQTVIVESRYNYIEVSKLTGESLFIIEQPTIIFFINDVTIRGELKEHKSPNRTIVIFFEKVFSEKR